MRSVLAISTLVSITAAQSNTAWVTDNGVDLTPTFDNAEVNVQTGVTSIHTCIDFATSKQNTYATLDGSTCKSYNLTYKYTRRDGVTSAARYNADDFECFGNSDLWGGDVWDTNTRFERCLDTCKNQFSDDGAQRCSAVAWVQNDGEEMGHCYLKYLKDDPLRDPTPNSRGAITCRSRASILRGLGYVRVDGVAFKVASGGTADANPGVTSVGQCARMAIKVSKPIANYDGKTCSLLDVSYTYELNPASTALVQYNAKDFACTGNGDFLGEDVSHSNMRFDACLNTCKNTNACNAVTWIQLAGQDMGSCYLKHLGSLKRPAGPNALGAISCK
ncbi:hypothetical protein As57867_004599, partial [Aphanomyces stellatus]